jgi:hypothetical protein
MCRRAGTIGAAYEALAPHAGVPEGQDPMELLLLVDLVAHRANKAFTDPEQRLADVREHTSLLAYRYPSPEAGPKSGGCEAHIVHRCGTLSFSSPESRAVALSMWLCL